MTVHKAAFYWKENNYAVTVCGVVNYNQNINKTQNWDEVSCKRCLMDKDAVPVSSVNLLN